MNITPNITTFHDFLVKNLDSTVMINLSIDGNESFQYNNWNWFHPIGQLHLLKDDFSIGHIIHTGSVEVREDGSLLHSSKYSPKISVLNFYFGGATP
jgi:hypothetical protein